MTSHGIEARSRRSRVALSLAAATLLVTAGAAAAEPSAPVTLTWRVPDEGASCPTREQMLAEIDRVLGPATGPRTSVTADGRVERGKREAFRVSLSLVTEGRRVERTFGAASCVEAAGAAALIVALAVDASARPPETAPFSEPPAPPAPAPTAPPEAPPKPPEVAPAPPPRPVPEPPSRSSDAPPPSRRTAFSAGIAGSGTVESGALPSATGGGQLSVFGAASFLRAEAELSVLAPSEAMVDAPTGRGGSFSALTFGGRVCALATFGRLAAGPCGGALVMNMVATGLGTVDARTESATWGALGGDALILVRLGGPLAVRARFGGVGSLDRPTFVIDAGGTRVAVHRPAASSFSGSVGVELHFF
ncbi:MAG: hypothetical protein IPK71_03045 [Myxococcales bacterium]|nr:hypothetical protein [Myxococcales bacterium]